MPDDRPAARDHEALALFEACLDLPAAERRGWLLAHCGDDAELCRLAMALHAADAAAGGPLQSDFTEPRVLTGTRVGPYRIHNLVAEGGMGAVYRAERDDGAYRQTVAVKLIRPNVMDAEAIRRFEAERRILAQIQHPNVARILDGGTLEDGTPYVVMEYVDGEPITLHCEHRRLDLAARLDLFRAVCDAVQAAHRNLVVHRDLKPGNILVTADGTPKLLDFGIAKMLQSEPGSQATRATTVALTPDYASPEQVLRHPITTSSDVYSLGVILYELVTGQLPYDLDRTTPAQAERLICSDPPPPPSEALAGQRADAIDWPPRALRGDLDNIILTALRKEPERRYGSVQELSDDIRRHLRGLPVAARRDSAGYRLAKFAGRHRWGMVAAGLLAVSLLAGSAATAWQARRAEQAARQALAQQDKAEHITRFFKTVLMSPSSQWLSKIGKGPDVSMAEVLDIASRRADAELANEPAIHADVLDTLSQAFQGMGLYDKARDNAERELAIVQAALPADDPLQVDAHYRLAQALHLKGNFEPAEAEYREAIRLGESILAPEAENLALLYNDLGVLLLHVGRFAEAEREQSHALELQRRRMHGQPYPAIAIGLGNLATIHLYRGDLDRAASAYRDALSMFEELSTPQRHYAEHAQTLRHLSALQTIRGDDEEAAATATRALEIGQATLGNEHPTYALLLLRRAATRLSLGETEGVDATLEQARGILDRHLVATHPSRAQLQLVRGRYLTAVGNPSRAIEALREARAILEAQPEATDRPEHVHALVLAHLGNALIRSGDTVGGRELLQRGVAESRLLYGRDVAEMRAFTTAAGTR